MLFAKKNLNVRYERLTEQNEEIFISCTRSTRVHLRMLQSANCWRTVNSLLCSTVARAHTHTHEHLFFISYVSESFAARECMRCVRWIHGVQHATYHIEWNGFDCIQIRMDIFCALSIPIKIRYCSDTFRLEINLIQIMVDISIFAQIQC